MTIFASCNSNKAARGDKSIPPKPGMILRHTSSKGSVSVAKMEAAALKVPGFIQLSSALANTANTNTLISKEINWVMEVIAKAPILIILPFNSSRIEASASICKDNISTSDEVSIFPIDGTNRRRIFKGGWVILTRNWEIGL